MKTSNRDFPARRCTAKSKQSGEQCKRYAIKGGTVCKIHGGGIPVVKAKAAQTVTEWRIMKAMQIEKAVAPYMNGDAKGAARLIAENPSLLTGLLKLADGFRSGEGAGNGNAIKIVVESPNAPKENWLSKKD